MSYPAALPSYPDTQGNETLATAGGGVGLSGILDLYGVDITAIATRLGTGSGVNPTANKILIGTGDGTSEWGATLESLTFTGVPYIQGANGVIAISADTDGGEYNFSVDTTGTLAFFGSAGATLNLKLLDGDLTLDTGTLYTDDIGEKTAANGVNIDGLNIKDGKLNTNDSVVTANITDDAVTAPKLSGIDKSNLTTDSNPYSFSAYMGSTQSTVLTTWTKLNMNTEEWDTNSNYNTSTYGYTIPVTGFYHFTIGCQLQSQAATPFIVSISTDGSTEYRRGIEIPNTTGNISLSASFYVSLAASAVVYPMYYSGTASKTLTAGALTSRFQGRLIHRT